MTLAKAFDPALGPILQIDCQGSTIRSPQSGIDIKAMNHSAMLRQASPDRYLHDKIQVSDHINVVFELIVDD